MKIKLNVTFLLLLVVNILIFTVVEARGGRGGGIGRGHGGSIGGSRIGGSRAIQRSPSMSRTSNIRSSSRGSINRASTRQSRVRPSTRPASLNPGLGSQSNARNRVNQFINNHPSARIPNRSPSQNIGRQVRNNTNINRIGRNVRNNINVNYPNRRAWFNRNFWNNHNYYPPYYHSYANWWGVSTAAGIGSWLGWQGEPYYYGYDNDEWAPTNYENSGYSSGSSSNTAYVEQDSTENSQNLSPDDQWMPLGVFSISKNNETVATPTMFVQLALSKTGDVSGTFYNALSNQVYEIEGGVDEGSQKIMWQVSDNPSFPFAETGVYNLSQDEVPTRLHFSNGFTQDMILIRIKE